MHEHQCDDLRPFENGASAADIIGVSWQKSRRSNSQGNCVELAALPSRGRLAASARHLLAALARLPAERTEWRRFVQRNLLGRRAA